VLDVLSPRGPRFAHVVFADVALRARPVDHVPRHEPAPPRTEPARLAVDAWEFIDWLFRRAGLDAAVYRGDTLARRLPSCLRALGSETYDEARRLVERHPRLLDTALETLVVGVTGFFRDSFVFAVLADRVLPALADAGRGLNVWSVGCSDGRELYSVAMLLDEHDLLERSYLVGTDCRSAAVAQARAGLFDEDALADVPAETAARYFERVASGWRVARPLRDAMRWWVGDALRLPEIGAWDVILCRNLAIYLYPDAADRLWRRLAGALRVGGFLVTGKAERPRHADGLVNVAPCTYRRARRW
jgi:chemotaxis methyl-accepting protein methylase